MAVVLVKLQATCRDRMNCQSRLAELAESVVCPSLYLPAAAVVQVQLSGACLQRSSCQNHLAVLESRIRFRRSFRVAAS
jgi:hypothetical protein